MTATLGIGTVQFGLNYGIANKNGQTPPEEVRAILETSRQNGVKVIDTAAAYGSSEEILGQQDLNEFQVVTKIPSLKDYSIDEKLKVIETSVANSLQHLGLPKLSGLMLHDANDLLSSDGPAVWRQLEQIKEDGLTDSVGSSVYCGQQINALLSLCIPDILQLPINVLDQRLLNGGQLAHIESLGIEVHARSAFLQGLLLLPLDQVPAYFDPIRHILERWHTTTSEQGFTPAQAALSFLKYLKGIDAVIVGVDNHKQFLECMDAFTHCKPFDASGLACDDPAFVNPALWRMS